MLALTFVTLAIAGGAWWAWEGPQITTLSDFLNPAILWQTVVAGTSYSVAVLIILGCHEMGHYLACRYYRIPSTLPYFIPGPPPVGSFGAVIRIRGRIPHRRALFDIAAAGPLAGFAATLPILWLGLAGAKRFVPPPDLLEDEVAYLGEPLLMVLAQKLFPGAGEIAVDSLIGAAWVGLLVTSLNLFPVGQLDGGHAAYAVSRRFHATITRLTLIGLFGVVVAQVLVYRQFPFYIVWFAILLWMRDRHPPLLDETTPLGTGRKWVGGLLLVIFALSFIFIPIYVGE